MPRKMVRRIAAQKSCHRAMVQRIASRSRDSPVGADFSCRNGKNDATECGVAQFVRPRPIARILRFACDAGTVRMSIRLLKPGGLSTLRDTFHAISANACFIHRLLPHSNHCLSGNTKSSLKVQVVPTGRQRSRTSLYTSRNYLADHCQPS